MLSKELLLEIITELSHEFGGEKYVKGGGGNTSCKTDDRLWVKPSGTTLLNIQPELFVEMDRIKLGHLFQLDTPQDSAERESLVKSVMEESRVEGSLGRASVEAPLHNCLNYTYVVHTHPVLVNAFTCCIQGKKFSLKWFPEALWVDYIDPGYTLSIHVDALIKDYEHRHGQQPTVIILQNHGIFIAGNTADDIRARYAQIMSKLEQEIGALEIESNILEDDARLYAESILSCFPDAPKNSYVMHSVFSLPSACLTPDHMVYMKSRPFYGRVTAKSLIAFQARYGYLPKVFVGNEAVVAIADSPRSANLAMDLAKDAAMVIQGAQRLGGVRCMGEEDVSFIENWEVESYRQKQMA
jgi:rhamnose utilization protein RhaD (predicted bifunctional aldolase and dehydrogenase)